MKAAVSEMCKLAYVDVIEQEDEGGSGKKLNGSESQKRVRP
jgi:hypothetical protein